MRRDWTAARAKCDAEARCRVCGDRPVEAAHVIGRARDERRDGVAVVNPDSIVPLCGHCHRAEYDVGTLDLLPFLTTAEQVRAVADAGSIMAALRRISGRKAA